MIKPAYLKWAIIEFTIHENGVDAIKIDEYDFHEKKASLSHARNLNSAGYQLNTYYSVIPIYYADRQSADKL